MRDAALRTDGEREAADFEQAPIASGDEAIAERGELGLGFLASGKEVEGGA
jgi:hypothetical protein